MTGKSAAVRFVSCQLRHPEQPEFRRRNRKDEKQDRHQGAQEPYAGAVPVEKIRLAELPGSPESDENTDKKYRNVHGGNILPHNAGIRVEEYRDAERSGQVSGKECCRKYGRKSGCPLPGEKGKQQQGEKDKFHMFPGRFIDREKQSGKTVLTAPVIEKMCQRPDYPGKEDASGNVMSDFFHNHHLHVKMSPAHCMCR